METYIILGILALMVIVMVSGKFAFAVPPMAAVILMALTGVVTIQEAFSGFTNNYLIVTAAFLVISTAFSKTSLIGNIQQATYKLMKKKEWYHTVCYIDSVCHIASKLFTTGSKIRAITDEQLIRDHPQFYTFKEIEDKVFKWILEAKG